MISVLLLLVATVLLGADTKERVYDAPFDKVWLTCVQVASEEYTVTFSDKASGIFTFQEGASRFRNSSGVNVGVTVTAVNDHQTRVVLNPRKIKVEISLKLSDIAKKYFKAVDARVVNASPAD